jgi:diguanylate cyclase (GGDEF)-like protein/PAS domain S-box-containing protein
MRAPALALLLVEDNAADAGVTTDMLALSRAPRYFVTHAARIGDALELLSGERFDIVLLDLGLPDVTGIAGVRAVRAAAPEAALIVLSGTGDEAIAVEALEAGAEDYIVKDRAGEDGLQRSIRFAIVRRDADVAHRRFAALVESSQDAILTTDLDARITSWNDAAERLYGYSRDEAVGQSLAILVPPERAGEERDIIARAIAGERFDAYETKRVRKDGSVVTVSLTASVIRDARGRAVAVSSIARDITERAQARAELHAAQERFRIAFEKSPIGMAIVGLDGRFLRVNDALAEITGHAVDELEGRATTSLRHPEDPPLDGDCIGGLLERAGSHFSTDRRILDAGGRLVWAAVSVTCVRDADARPEHFLVQVQDITDRRRTEAQLQHMADHDPLTGLLNRRAFETALREHAARSARYGIRAAAVMIDLDHFKYYNDTLGHGAGDELIVRVAGAISKRLRSSDVLARLGGDEFAVILPSTDAAGARRLVEGLLECVRNEGTRSADGERSGVTASIGIAFFDDELGLEPEDIMVNADLAMYHAKEGGRDRLAFYRAGHHSRVRMRGRMTWVQEIRGALGENRFELLAQPIVDLHGGRERRLELLLRMRSADGDLIPPAAFLNVAERLDLIQEIDRWVVGQATTLLAANPGLALEINLSGKSIGSADLLALVERRLRETAIDPGRLTFEITETTAVANIALARSFSERLHALGCRFALDDFGAGFGSFYYLKHLPFDYLKIDGEFIRNVASDSTDRLLVTAVVDIARGMGKETVAECVGDAATVAALRALGVDWGQGFHLGEPEPLAVLLPGVSLA